MNKSWRGSGCNGVHGWRTGGPGGSCGGSVGKGVTSLLTESSENREGGSTPVSATAQTDLI